MSAARLVTASTLRVSWALWLAGAREMAGLALGPAASAARLDRLSAAAEATFGPALRRVYELGDGVQGGVVDAAFAALDPRTALALARRSAGGARVLADGASGAALVELRNKIEVFFLVKDVARRIGVPAGGPFPLPDLVRRAYALGAFPALWAVEGLGHEYADSHWRRGLEPRGLLAPASTGELPAGSLLMLHAGIGLSFAQRRLGTLAPGADDAALGAAVDEVLALCRDNSRPGYAGAAIESLGLVTRTFHPALVARVDARLRGREAERGFFWHGVGRAIYFLPINFLPCSAAATFAMLRAEAPDEAARRSALAGLAWAFLLVNQRQPSVLAELVVAPHGPELERDDAFADGVASAAVMRTDTTPDAPFLRSLSDHRPPPAAEDAWDALVRRPLRRGSERYQPALARHACLDQVFRYQDLEALLTRVSGGAA